MLPKSGCLSTTHVLSGVVCNEVKIDNHTVGTCRYLLRQIIEKNLSLDF